ncbi:MAG: hypothetical protein JO040_07900 [Gemmatimonadetes bacterium]|nr:hypothetical protein [Gemmatimonadota bacterium]
MATQPAAARGVGKGRTPPPDPAEWRAYHLFYHADRDRLVTELVRPTVADLLREGEIGSFYFVRYNLGGPHVRLRLKPGHGRAGSVDARVRRAAAEFFQRRPSSEPVAEEVIRRQNRGIVASDPLSGGVADEVFPDNTLEEFPPLFEVERYGGPRLFRHSLDFFTLSSVEALHFLSGLADPSAGQRLSGAFRLCVRQAWGFARDDAEFTELLSYASRIFTHDLLARFAERGDEAFERQRDAYTRLLRDELALCAGTGGPGGPPAITVGARRLAREIRKLDDAGRWTVAASQLHMTANRLGLLNPEELYLGRILWRAARELAVSEPVFWKEAWTAHRQQGRKPGARLRDLLGPALKRLR